MEKIKCKNGHYYDPDKHTSCPYCGIDIADFAINRASHIADYQNHSDVEAYGKTIPIQDIIIEKPKEIKTEPVVGWLVVLSEKNKGKDYRILSGRNKIGRGETNEISLYHDEDVSLMEHANIIYEPSSNNFYLTLGGGRGLIYLNDQLLLAETKLKKEDHIKIGKTELVFIPFCTETFCW
jgi:pSer/pThr/pTyr-binding forkhead associated (FHA) protein